MLTHSIDSILAPSKPGPEVDTREEKALPVAECADTSGTSSSERKRKNSFDCEECGTPSPVSTPRTSGYYQIYLSACTHLLYNLV